MRQKIQVEAYARAVGVSTQHVRDLIKDGLLGDRVLRENGKLFLFIDPAGDMLWPEGAVWPENKGVAS